MWSIYLYDFVLVILLPTLNRFHALIYFSYYQFWTWMLRGRCVFRTQSNIYDGVFTKMVKDFHLLTIFAKSSILDVRLGSRYASVIIISKTKSGFDGCNIAWGFCLFETNWTFSFAFFQLTFLLRFFCLKIVCFTNEHMIYPHKRYC